MSQKKAIILMIFIPLLAIIVGPLIAYILVYPKDYKITIKEYDNLEYINYLDDIKTNIDFFPNDDIEMSVDNIYFSHKKILYNYLSNDYSSGFFMSVKYKSTEFYSQNIYELSQTYNYIESYKSLYSTIDLRDIFINDYKFVFIDEINKKQVNMIAFNDDSKEILYFHCLHSNSNFIDFSLVKNIKDFIILLTYYCDEFFQVSTMEVS